MANNQRQRHFEARQMRVAALIVVGLLLLAYGVYQAGKIMDVFAKRYTVVTKLPSVAGLSEGAPVTLAGKQVGQVKEIRFIPMRMKRDSNNLFVKLQIAEHVRDQVRHDSRVLVRAAGLLGDKYVDIQPGTLRTTALRDNDTIPALVAMDMDQFLAEASAMLDQANLLVKDLGGITHSLASGKGTMGQLLYDPRLYNQMTAATGQLSALLNDMNRGEGSLGRMIHDPAMYEHMTSAMARVDSLGRNILHGTGTLSMLIGNDSIYRGLNGMVGNANVAAARLADMMQKLNDPKGSMNKFLTDPRLFDEFLKSVIDLQTLLADVRQNPKKYVPPINVKVF